MIFHGLGDCINSTVIIDALRHEYPNSDIFWVTCEQYKDVVLYNGGINGVISVTDGPIAADRHYDIHSLPGKTLTPAPYRNRMTGTLLEHFQSLFHSLTGVRLSSIVPTINLSLEEVTAAKEWLRKKSLLDKKFAVLEVKSGSSATRWDQSCTIFMLQELQKRGFDAALLTHPSDGDLPVYNNIMPTYCMDVGYRLVIPIYNLCSFFSGCGSSATVLTHTSQAFTHIPHMEFVRGRHWSSELYKPKKHKKIIHCDALTESTKGILLNTLKELL